MAKKQKAIATDAVGITHAITKETLTNTIAIVDFVMALIRYAIGKGESIEMEFRIITIIRNGSGANSKYSVERSANNRWRISSLVGEPPLIFSQEVNREVTRNKIEVTAIKLKMLKTTP